MQYLTLNNVTCGLTGAMFSISNYMIAMLSSPFQSIPTQERFLLLKPKSKKLCFFDDELLCILAMLYFARRDGSLTFAVCPIDRTPPLGYSYPLKWNRAFLNDFVPDKHSNVVNRIFLKYYHEGYFVMSTFQALECCRALAAELKVNFKYVDTNAIVRSKEEFTTSLRELGVDRAYAMFDLRHFDNTIAIDRACIVEMLTLAPNVLSEVQFYLDICLMQYDMPALEPDQLEHLPAWAKTQYDFEEIISPSQYILRICIDGRVDNDVRSGIAHFLTINNPIRNDLFINQLPRQLIDYINLLFLPRVNLPNTASSSILESSNLSYFKKNVSTTVTMYRKTAVKASALHHNGNGVTIIHNGAHMLSTDTNNAFLEDLTVQYDLYENAIV